MGPLLVDLVSIALLFAALYGSPTTILAVLIGSLLLVPDTLVVPHLHTSYATLNHVVIAAAALRLALMAFRKSVSRDTFHATPIHLGLALLAVTSGATGVIFAPATTLPAIGEQRLVNIVFVAGFFVISLALIRMIDNPWLIMRMLTATFAAAAAIAVIEHLTGDAFGHFLFSIAGHPGSTVAAHVLERRAGHNRVRSSSEFALAFAWVAVMLLPVVTVVGVRLRRWVILGLPLILLVAAAIYWTYARSAAGAIPIVLVLLAIGARDRRTGLLASAAILAAVTVFALDPTIRHHLSLTTDAGSVGIRFQRLPVILDAVSHRPYLGLGFGGLIPVGFPTTDNFYLSAYAEGGVVSAAVLVALCVTATAQAARGLRVTDPNRRALIAACVAGFIAFLGSGAFDDALLIAQPAELAMLLLALATAAAEPELGFLLLPKWSTPRLLFFTSTGALIGLAAFLLAPVTVSQERTFTTVSPTERSDPGNFLAAAPAYIGTVCDIARALEPTMPSTHISCRDNFSAAGVGTLRVQSKSATQTLAAFTAMSNTAHETYYLQSYDTLTTGPPVKARATFWQTAPVSGGMTGLAVAFIAPLPIRRRRPHAEQRPKALSSSD